ncbi:MAG: hypothetical protein IT548_02595 [Alphaproteobacteria bacterium]|nr:hypothetical protein [Alphaproteobacteria bacterium]
MIEPIESIAVVRSHGGWRVLRAKGPAGDYAFQVDAEDAALKVAKASQPSGGRVEILVQQPGGELRPFPMAPPAYPLV